MASNVETNQVSQATAWRRYFEIADHSQHRKSNKRISHHNRGQTNLGSIGQKKPE